MPVSYLSSGDSVTPKCRDLFLCFLLRFLLVGRTSTHSTYPPPIFPLEVHVNWWVWLPFPSPQSRSHFWVASVLGGADCRMWCDGTCFRETLAERSGLDGVDQQGNAGLGKGIRKVSRRCLSWFLQVSDSWGWWWGEVVTANIFF